MNYSACVSALVNLLYIKMLRLTFELFSIRIWHHHTSEQKSHMIQDTALSVFRLPIKKSVNCRQWCHTLHHTSCKEYIWSHLPHKYCTCTDLPHFNLGAILHQWLVTNIPIMCQLLEPLFKLSVILHNLKKLLQWNKCVLLITAAKHTVYFSLTLGQQWT